MTLQPNKRYTFLFDKASKRSNFGWDEKLQRWVGTDAGGRKEAAKYNRADRLAVVLAYVIAIGSAVVALVGLVWAIDLIWP